MAGASGLYMLEFNHMDGIGQHPELHSRLTASLIEVERIDGKDLGR